MAAYDLEEQDKIDDLKAFWARWGNLISLVISAVAIAFIAVQGWRWWQNKQADEASVLYGAVTAAVRASDVAKARDAMSQLADRFASTGYAPRAALLYAKLAWDQGDKAGAKAQLQWVIDRAGEDELKQVARYRLAEALFDDKQHDQALATLDARHADSFAGLYADLRGDVLAAAGRVPEAKTAYQTALAKLDPKSPYRNYVQVKLDALPGEKAAPTGGSAAGAATTSPNASPGTPSGTAAGTAAPAPIPAAAKGGGK
jgi:predicted negative regulator of RcsB-dependent stress response